MSRLVAHFDFIFSPRLLVQHKGAPLKHPDETMLGVIAKLLLSPNSAGSMPDTKGRMKTLTRKSVFCHYSAVSFLSAENTIKLIS